MDPARKVTFAQKELHFHWVVALVLITQMKERRNALYVQKATTVQRTQHPTPHTPVQKVTIVPMELSFPPSFHALKVTLITEPTVRSLKTALHALVECIVTVLGSQGRLASVILAGSVLEQHGLLDQLIIIISLLVIVYAHLLQLVGNASQVFTVHKGLTSQNHVPEAIIASLKEERK